MYIQFNILYSEIFKNSEMRQGKQRTVSNIPLSMLADKSGSSFIINERKDVQWPIVSTKWVNFDSLSPHSKPIEPSFKESLTPWSNKVQISF